jgi:hypothetical protein
VVVVAVGVGVDGVITQEKRVIDNGSERISVASG